MAKVVWTIEALERLMEIELYIARDYPQRSEKFIESLINRGNSLAENPRRGRIVPEFSDPQIRELIHGNYRLVYLARKDKINILTVFEGHSRFPKTEVPSGI